MGNCIHFQLSNQFYKTSNTNKQTKSDVLSTEKSISTLEINRKSKDVKYPLILRKKQFTITEKNNCFHLDNKDLIPENINPKTLDNFIPNINSGRVIKVYDGDTVTIACYFPNIDKENHLQCSNKLYKFSIRLKGIDCPEIRSKDPNEKDIAILAREFIHKLIYNKVVYLKDIQMEKYGRLLADVYINNESCSELLLQHRFAVKYNGKTKEKINWLQYHTIA